MASYYKNDKGKWGVRFRVHGKQKHISGFTTKREAENAYILFPKDETGDNFLKPKFDEVYQRFIEFKKGKVKDSTVLSYLNCYKRYLKKFRDDYSLLS